MGCTLAESREPGEREICEACGKRRIMGAGCSAVEPDGLCSRCTAARTVWYDIRKGKTMQRSILHDG